MEIAQIEVSGVRARALVRSPIPVGMVGGTVRFVYTDPLWDSLTKTVVFQCVDVTKDILNAGELVTIPPEVTALVNQNVVVGVYGTDGQQNLVIPTLWAAIGRVRDAASPSGDTSTDETLPVWAQLKDRFLLAAGDTYAAGGTGGEAEHALTASEIAEHRHGVYIRSSSGSYSATEAIAQSAYSYESGGKAGIAWAIGSTGLNGDAHNNMPPYLAVYMWKRTA